VTADWRAQARRLDTTGRGVQCALPLVFLDCSMRVLGFTEAVHDKELTARPRPHRAGRHRSELRFEGITTPSPVVLFCQMAATADPEIYEHGVPRY
jgi:hypothetical protein